jgi:hydrophobic/amphiphilic exporter-1 (mainly G- bacteria), HAE1 family
MIFVAAMVFGYFSYERLSVTLMPELSYPSLTVRTQYSGAAPTEVEKAVSQPIEGVLAVVGGLNKISSVSRSGVSDVLLEFVWGTDMSSATQDVLEKLDRVRLPPEVDKPLLLRFDPSLDPILELSFSGNGDRYQGEQGLRRLRRIAEGQIKRVLESIDGVASVRIRGGLEEQVNVSLDAGALARSNTSIKDVYTRLQKENINSPGGTLTEGGSEYTVRTLNEFVNLNQIRETTISKQDEREIKLKDLGTVVSGHKEQVLITRTDGNETVQINLYKEAEANIVDVVQQVRYRVGTITEAQKVSPTGGKLALAQQLWQQEQAVLQITKDQSVFIENSIDEVRRTALIGGLLATVILFLFLGNAKATAIVAISIPMSVLMVFAPLNLLDVSLNIMSLGGLAMGVGMLVDSSIVVLESIFRCQEEGDDRRSAAIRGTQEVRGAVIASTLTSICVFFPMVFVEGIAGQAFGDLGFTVMISLLASLVVAIWFIPMLASRENVRLVNVQENRRRWLDFYAWRAFQSHRERYSGWKKILLPYAIIRLGLGALIELFGKILLWVLSVMVFSVSRGIFPLMRMLNDAVAKSLLQPVSNLMQCLNLNYAKVIQWALANPVKILLIVCLNGVVLWQAGSRLGAELLPPIHQNEFTFEVRLPIGTPINQTQSILSNIEKAILDNKQDIASVIVTYGYDIASLDGGDVGEHSAQFRVLLHQSPDPKQTEQSVLRRLRPYFDLPDISYKVVRPVLFSSSAPIEVEVIGDDLQQLKAVSQQVKTIMRSLSELADVESTLKAGGPEVQIIYDREQVARFGLNINDVATQVRDKVQGVEAKQFVNNERRIPILVRLHEDDRAYIKNIEQMPIVNESGISIPLATVAKLVIGEGPNEIRRIDGYRSALVQANIKHGSLDSAVAHIQTALHEQIIWPHAMTFRISGQNQEWQRSKDSLYLALGLSVFLVFVIMAAQFESLLQPLIIMFTIPLAFSGSVIGLWASHLNLSIVVLLGMIMLTGIVVNNAIVFIAYMNTLRERGLLIDEAIIKAGSVRLRPILMTAATTVFGLLPMAFGMGEGAEIRAPMAITVVYGLISSTILTLLVVPTACSLLDKLKVRFIVIDERHTA